MTDPPPGRWSVLGVILVLAALVAIAMAVGDGPETGVPWCDHPTQTNCRPLR